jgi:translocation and assembly module TamB
MKRRHLVVLVSAITLVTIIFVAAVTIGVGVGTDPGRDQIRGLVQQQIGSRVHGKVHIGRVRGGFLTGFTIDSFAIRDLQDSILVSTGRVTVQYDLRDLMDRRILLRNVQVEHPLVRLHQHQKGDWNFQRIFRNDGPSTPGVPGRSFGDYVVLDSVRIREGTFLVTRPWSPDDTLTGAKRDSAIRRNLANPAREIRRSAEGLTQTHRWSRATGFLPRIRLADPDSNRFGQLFVIGDLSVDEKEPPFQFSKARGEVRRLKDSIFVNVSHFDLPASTGSAQGKIWWGSGLPVRVDVRIKGDSVSLKDVAWVYETLPRTGSGRTDLRITNNKTDLHDFDYALTNMDVRSTRSRLSGNMTFAVGGPVLVVRDVDLRAAPVNFDLVRVLAGGPLPDDWQGDLFGMVRGPGGPLTHFVVDTSFVTFRDAHVIGAISQATGRGGLNILDPEFTEFRGFDVNALSIDLRTLEYLYPAFPRIGGTISGVATLDSSWMDVRFSKANIIHRNGPGEPTRATGSGRVTYGEEFLTYDVTVNAEPLSLTMMSRAYPLGLKGLMSGPIRAKGTTNDLQLTMNLEGPAGRFSYTGRVDAYPLSVAARGSGRVDQLDLSRLLEMPKAPSGSISGAYQVDVRGDTNDLGTLRGVAAAQIERSELDGIRVFPSRVRARFADGRMFLDTLRIESVAATVTAAGALGLTNRVQDSLQYQITVDSLGGLRRYVTRFTSSFRTASATQEDSLSGSLLLQGTASGSLESLNLSGSLTGRNVFVRREAGREITGSFALADVLKDPTGAASLRFDRLNIAGIALDTLGVAIRLTAPRSGVFTIGARAANGVTFAATGDLGLGETHTSVLLRAAALVTDSGRWSLRGPANIDLAANKDLTIDSLVMANARGGRLALSGFVPDSGPARLQLRADSVPLRDVGQIMQLKDSLGGFAQMTLTGAGTSAAPTMTMQARVNDLRYGTLRLERVTGRADYAGRRAQVAVDVASGGRTALLARGSLPVELTYFGAELLDDSLRATVRTDSANFNMIQALVPGLDSASGRLIVTLDVSGTWKHPDISGPVRVENGQVFVDSLGIWVRGITADIGFFGHRDSLAIRRVVGWSGTGPSDSLSLSGYIGYRDLENPYFNLRLNARSFYAFDKRSVARVFVSTEPAGLRLRGQLEGATLTGGIIVDRATIFLPDPEISRKQYADFTSVVRDTATVRQLGLGPSSKLFESILFDGVRVTLGDEVWLRSPEANIKLGGQLDIQRRASRSTRLAESGLLEVDTTFKPMPEGTLYAERGTYRLDLGRVVQREFQVEGGTVTFFGSEDLPAILNISALHTLRAATTGAEVRIRVRLTGTLDAPILELESAESYAMSQSNMVSYLIFGQPNFELGSQNQDIVNLAAQAFFPTATAFTASQLRGLLGPLAELLQLRPGSADVSKGVGGLGGSIEDAILRSRVGAEKQITQNLFVSLSSGLCPFQGNQTPSGSTEISFVEGLGGRFEYRFSRDASVKLGKEPGESSCRATNTGRVVAAPSQWGLSFFKTWRF